MINCINQPDWGRAVTDAHRSRRISLVLSPWHFYEYANGATHQGADELIRFVENLQPRWIMESADLQLFEFWIVWRQIWESSRDTVLPIGSFAEIIAVLSKIADARLEKVSIQEYVTQFADATALEYLRNSVGDHRIIAATNRRPYLERKSDKAFRRELELSHLAIQFARLQLKTSDPEKVFARAKDLMSAEPIATQMQIFSESGFARELKCHQTEVALAEELYAGQAALDGNRYVDRQHATVALPYCDRFITDDADLTKRCQRVKAALPWPTAKIMKAHELIEELTTGH